MFARIIKMAWPVMLTYIAVGIPCGVLEAQTGMTPWMVFLLSATYVSGGGQFMMSNLWLAGVPLPSIVASVAAISSRFALSSASLTPYLKGATRGQTLAVSATLTEEAYGMSLTELARGDGWGPAEAFCLNIVLIFTWAVSCAVGAAVGAVLTFPTAIAGFVCTSLFISLLFSQSPSYGNVMAALTAVFAVAVCKFAGAANVAVPVGAVAGVAVALGAGALRSARGDHCVR